MMPFRGMMSLAVHACALQRTLGFDAWLRLPRSGCSALRILPNHPGLQPPPLRDGGAPGSTCSLPQLRKQQKCTLQSCRLDMQDQGAADLVLD